MTLFKNLISTIITCIIMMRYGNYHLVEKIMGGKRAKINQPGDRWIRQHLTKTEVFEEWRARTGASWEKQLGEMPWKFLSCQLNWNCMNNFNHFLNHDFLKRWEQNKSGLARKQSNRKTFPTLILVRVERLLIHWAAKRTATSMWWQLLTFQFLF